MIVAPGGGAVARLGITASRKIGNAVTRNRAKRLVREAFRATRDLWPAFVDLVVVVRKPLGDARLEEVVREWRAASGALRKKLGRLAELAPAPGEGKTPGARGG